jgi:transcriptional regulator with XRE-family HTH domain
MDEDGAPGVRLARNLAQLRHSRSLTQDALARAAGLPRSTIANLESGEGNPSLAVLVKVSNALGAPVDELLSAPRARVRLWKAAEVAEQRAGHGLHIRPLVPEPAPDETMTIMRFDAAGAMRGTPHLPGSREYFTCLAGRVSIGVAGERFELAAGDVLAFPGNLPHAYQNLDARSAAQGVSVVIFAKAG